MNTQYIKPSKLWLTKFFQNLQFKRYGSSITVVLHRFQLLNIAKRNRMLDGTRYDYVFIMWRRWSCLADLVWVLICATRNNLVANFDVNWNPLYSQSWTGFTEIFCYILFQVFTPLPLLPPLSPHFLRCGGYAATTQPYDSNKHKTLNVTVTKQRT